MMLSQHSAALRGFRSLAARCFLGTGNLLTVSLLTVSLLTGCDSKAPQPADAPASAALDKTPATPGDATTNSPTNSPAADSKTATAIKTPALEAAGAKLTRDASGVVTAVDLRECKLNDAVVVEIAMLTSLQQLDLRECELNNVQLQSMVAKLTKLKALRLSGKGGATSVDDEGLAALAVCSDLRVLAADELWFSEEGLKKLSGCKNLTELYIAGTLIEDATMPTVATFTQLKKLRLAKTAISRTGLQTLAALKLEDLDLSECSQINDAAMEEVAKFTTLKRLNLWRDPISDAGCSKLAGLKQLTWYNLDNTQLTDAGLDHLSGMTELTFLHLGSTGVSDAGMPKLLGLTKLKDLKVTRTAVTEEGAKLLTDKLPDLKVQVKYREEAAQ